MQKKGYSFGVGELIHADHGTRIRMELEESELFSIDENIIFKPPLKADVTFMKIDNAIHVNLENIMLNLQLICSKCLSKFIYKMKIPQAERVYYFEKQRGIEMDDIDTFYVDMKRLVIDLKEFLRQEIILHFPQVQVCLKSCKGLCSKCGSNLNKGRCKCAGSDYQNKPLSVLKKLYNKF
ncbi:DUF177 domain-containing protein [Candidatus Peregrinibacteria bacterium]|nr:DUF177 domain-containing protein [Candidatus Peregrinibacteria bacterium]